MSEPRARVEIKNAAGIPTGLAQARASLLRSVVEPAMPHHTEATHQPDHAAHEHTGHDEHADHDHHSMSPDGIPLAEGADDRDGLEMDALHLPLGPVLNHWPAGVVLHLTLNGDVVTSAEGERLDSPGSRPSPEHGADRAARLLDSAASLLSLAGLPAQYARTRHLRDRCLLDSHVDPHDVELLATRLRRLRVLRWIWRQTVVTDAGGATIGLHDQLVGLVEQAARSLDGNTTPGPAAWPSLAALASLVCGQELAAVRLWVAALGVDAFHGAEQEVTHDH